MEADGGKIQYAYFLKDWVFDPQKTEFLKENAIPVKVSEYTSDMKCSIFCPECCVPIFRTPENKDYDRRGRQAHFAHSRNHPSVCGLRTLPGEGKRYENEEVAKQAIENGELVIVRGFLREKPNFLGSEQSNVYQAGAIENQDGGLTDVPIARHFGEKFQLPSVYTTVRGICWSFEENLDKYFFLPGQDGAKQLRKIIKDVNSVSETTAKPGLYFGKISYSQNMGSTERNVRLTSFLYNPRESQKDFSLKMIDLNSRDHGIDDDCKGRIVLIFGQIVKNGIGLCFENPKWGEISLLSEKYNDIIYSLN
jgi:hypothetical protein